MLMSRAPGNQPGPDRQEKRLALIRALWLWTVILLGMIAATTLLMPVYTDEIATVMMRGMYFVNGARLNTLLPQCRPTDFLTAVPLTLLPGAWISGVLYAIQMPWLLRIVGTLTWVVVMWLTWQWCRAQFPGLGAKVAAFVCVTGIASLGIQPFLLAMVRAEQIIVLTLAFYLLAPALAKRAQACQSRWPLIGIAVIFTLATSFCFYLHPKVLFYFPIAIVSALVTFWRSSRLLAAWCVLYTLACTAQSLLFFTVFTQCLDAPKLASYMADLTVSPALALKTPGLFFDALWYNAFEASEGIWKYILFHTQSHNDFIAIVPFMDESRLAGATNQAITLLSATTFQLACFVPPLCVLWHWIRGGRRPEAFFVGAGWITLMGQAAIFRSWNFYAGVPMLYLAATLIVMSIGLLSWRLWARGVFLAGTLAIAAVLTSSTYLLAARVAPALIAPAMSVRDGIPKQTYSVPLFRYAQQRNQIRVVASKCGIAPKNDSRLLVDPLTFGAFDNIREPILSDYILSPGFGDDVRDPESLRQLLEKIRATKLVALCTRLPPNLLAIAKRDGNVCCLDLGSASD